MERIWVNLDRYGNTSAASVPIALCEAEAAGKLDEGDNVVFVAFGGGLAWAAGVVRWGAAGVCRDAACRGSRAARTARPSVALGVGSSFAGVGINGAPGGDEGRARLSPAGEAVGQIVDDRLDRRRGEDHG
jgi:hypothetical protein